MSEDLLFTQCYNASQVYFLLFICYSCQMFFDLLCVAIIMQSLKSHDRTHHAVAISLSISMRRNVLEAKAC